MTTPTETRSGRPRDPRIDQRAMEAARRLYAQGGREAVTFEAISRMAGVGKPALYLRWNSADQILIDALSSFDVAPAHEPTGDTRADLVQFAESLLATYLAPEGAVVLRLMTELHQHSDLISSIRTSTAEAAIGRVGEILQSGIDAGELDPGLSAPLVTGLLSGAVLHEAMARMRGLPSQTVGADFVDDLVDFVLAPITAPRHP